MNSTNLYCPDCEGRQQREWLLHDGSKYYCPHCGRSYTKAALSAAYKNEVADLESDAAFVRDMLDNLEAA